MLLVFLWIILVIECPKTHSKKYKIRPKKIQKYPQNIQKSPQNATNSKCNQCIKNQNTKHRTIFVKLNSFLLYYNWLTNTFVYRLVIYREVWIATKWNSLIELEINVMNEISETNSFILISLIFWISIFKRSISFFKKTLPFSF